MKRLPADKKLSINIILLLIIFLVFLPQSMIFANEVIITITLETITDSREIKNIIIYQGRANSELLNSINNARTIFFGNVEKAFIIEGRYFIEYLDGKLRRKYSIKNNYWIFDEYKEKFLRCSILSDLRGYLLDYIINNGYEL